jgi:hypothetical protein
MLNSVDHDVYPRSMQVLQWNIERPTVTTTFEIQESVGMQEIWEKKLDSALLYLGIPPPETAGASSTTE